MSIAVTCTQCGASLRVKDALSGKRGKCPHCEAILVVPLCEPPSPSDATGLLAAHFPPLPSGSPIVGEPKSGQRAPQVNRTQFRDELLAAFQGDPQPVGTTWAYRLGLLLVAVVMLILPLLYVGLILAVGYGMYCHAVYDVWLFQVARVPYLLIASAIAYFGVLFAGGMLWLFMVKPFFARPFTIERRRSLTREGEPVLFALVDRVCEAVGALRPRRIDVDCEVNASAHFRRGVWSMIVGNDLVLTIGLPLVAATNARQFAAILAHEFGHFTQGFGMRMAYLIRVTNGWLTRVVYERDQWDQWLAELAEVEDIRVQVIVGLTTFLIWLTRRILWVFMITSHVVAGYLLRQMEFDADRCAARLAGSEVVEENARIIAVLALGYQGAMADLKQFYWEGRLGDDLPHLIMANVERLTADAQKVIDRNLDESVTHLWDTHPCDKDRIFSARQENAPGVFHEKHAASMLFSDFRGLCRNVTWDIYRGIFGADFQRSKMDRVEDLMAKQNRNLRGNRALLRFFQGAFSTLRVPPLPFDVSSRAVDVQRTVAKLRDARQQMLDGGAAYHDLLLQYGKFDAQCIEAEQAKALLRAKVKVPAGAFSVSLNNMTEVASVMAKAKAGQAELARDAEPFEEAAVQRIMGALELLGQPKTAERIEEAPCMFAEGKRLLPVVSLLRRLQDEICAVRNTRAVVAALLARLRGNQQNIAFAGTALEYIDTLTQQIQSLLRALGAHAYPFEHAKGSVTIGEYVFPALPNERDLAAILHVTEQGLEKLDSTCLRAVSRLAAMAEEVEAAFGLPAVPEPEAAPDADGQ